MIEDMKYNFNVMTNIILKFRRQLKKVYFQKKTLLNIDDI